MNKTTTIINHLNTDRVIEISISGCKYIIFTIMYRNLIVVDITDKDNAILLLNRSYATRKDLSKAIDEVVVKASKAINNDDFVSNMDTCIYLKDIGNNDTTEEIIAAYKIIIEDYNL